jgi:outer membrane protein OmpA-like peptidoglycan-associated protein
MKRTVSLTALLMVVLPALVLAYPGIGGGRGVFRVQNALVEEDAGLTISLHAIGRRPTFPDATKMAWLADLIAPELSYAPLATKWAGAEVFASWGGIIQQPQSPTESKLVWGLHDLRAGAKLSFPYLPVLKLGASGTYEFIKRDDATYWLDPQAIPARNGFGWNGLMTLQFQDLMPSLPNLMVNYGEIEDATIYGAGAELAAGGFGLFVEARSLQPKDVSDGPFDTKQGEIRLTPGVAFGSGNSGLTLKAGYTFSFGPTAPEMTAAPDEVILGLVIATPFGKRAKREFGEIAGKVVDSRTGDALTADIRFPEDARLKPTKTGAGTGVFSVSQVPVGVVVVEVSAKGYHSKAFPLDVQADAVVQQEFALTPLVTYGVIAGKVTDATTGTPLVAAVEFPETELKSVKSAAATGAFRVDQVPVGVYTVTAEAEGFFKGTQTVQVEEGQVAAPMFALKTLTDVSTFTGRVSDKQKDTPLAADISFPGSDVAGVKSDAGTGVFSAEVPVGSYAVKVEAKDYVAQTAAIVVEKGKPQVKNFELVKEGMAITLRGVYFDYNKATIKPESRPALEDAAKILNDNPTIRVEIQGHTDSDGSDSYNLSLSERRAAAVVSYLVHNLGIDAGRLVSRGYGESNPVATNSTAEGKALNRRVEFVVLAAKQK